MYLELTNEAVLETAGLAAAERRKGSPAPTANIQTSKSRSGCELQPS